LPLLARSPDGSARASGRGCGDGASAGYLGIIAATFERQLLFPASMISQW
jgi:hypothetical protein